MANNKKADDHHVFGLSAWVVDCRRGGGGEPADFSGQGTLANVPARRSDALYRVK